jgi:hypothetical protein
MYVCKYVHLSLVQDKQAKPVSSEAVALNMGNGNRTKVHQWAKSGLMQRSLRQPLRREAVDVK